MEQYLKHKKPNLFFEFDQHEPQIGEESNQAQSQQDLIAMKNQLISHEDQSEKIQEEDTYDYRPSIEQEQKETNKMKTDRSKRLLKNNKPDHLENLNSQQRRQRNSDKADSLEQPALSSDRSAMLRDRQKDKYDIKLISKNPLMETSLATDLYMSQRQSVEQSNAKKLTGLGVIHEKHKKPFNSSRQPNQRAFGDSPDKILQNAVNQEQKAQKGQDFDQQFLKLAKKRSLMRRQLPTLQHKTSGIQILTHDSLPKSTSQKKLTKKGTLIDSPQKPLFMQKNLYPRKTVQPQKILNLNSFISQTLSPHELFTGVLQRDRTCCANRFYPKYNLYLTQGLKFIVSARRKSFKTTSNYIISSEQDNYDQKSREYSALLISNFSGSIFNLFDQGIVPQQSISNNPDKSPRQLLCTIHYQTAAFCSSDPRVVTVFMLKKPYKYLELTGVQLGEQQINLKELYQKYPQENKSKIYKAQSKKPNYNQYKKCYTMNFYGKMGMSSVKNMILIGQDDREILLIAKNESNQFVLDFAYPLEPRVAMGIVLSGFDFKWVCQ